jgi:hypothetical protein
MLSHERDKHKLFYAKQSYLCDSRYLENERMNKDCVENTTNVNAQWLHVPSYFPNKYREYIEICASLFSRVHDN